MKSNGVLVAAMAIGFTVSLRASAPPALPEADEIITRHVQSRGGLDRIHSLRSLIYRGTYHEGDFVSPEAAMSVMRPFYKLVGDAEKPNPDFAEGYDGSAWEFYGDPGIVLRTVGAAAAASRHGLAIDGPLVDYRDKGSTLEMRGIEKIGGRDAFWLRVRMRDGFEEDEFIDRQTWMLTASRKVAPVHAFGKAIPTETRFGDFRPVAGVLVPFASSEVEIATGKVLNEMRWSEIVANKDLDPAVFSPPVLKKTPLQSLIDHLFLEREDTEAVLWSYHEFHRAYPGVDSDAAIQAAGYQILKMNDVASAICLLEANAATHPRSSGAFFGLGRAYGTAGRPADARAAFEKALALDPANKRARASLDAMGKDD
jgi:Tetratricopeptide repeat